MDWRKSTYRDSNGGQCVEAASGSDAILVRDTTDHDGVTLSVPAKHGARSQTHSVRPVRSTKDGSP